MAEWLGEVPEHWEVLPAARVFRFRNVPNAGLAERRVLSLSYGEIVVRSEDALHGLVPASFASYQIVDPGCIVVRATDLQNDQNSLRVGFSRHRGIITSAYLCLEPKSRIVGYFGYLVLHAYDLNKTLYRFGSGLRRNLERSDFKEMFVLVPPPEEQLAVVKLLHAFDRRYLAYVRSKRRLTALLEEQKRAIIHRAVTGGLTPGAPLMRRDSIWFPELPAHWEIRRLKALVEGIDQGISPQAENRPADTDSWGVLKAGCVNGGVFREMQHKRLPSTVSFSPDLAVKPGDVLVSRASGSRKYVGSVARVHQLTHRLILSDKTFRPVFVEGVDPDFMVLAMNGKSYREQVEQAISGAEGLANNLPLSSLRSFVLPLPPIEEQKSIVDAVSRETTALDTAIAASERQIALLREFRVRLVADVVTGKLDVREAAARLPELPDEAEPLDDLDLATESEGDDDSPLDDDLSPADLDEPAA